MNMDEIKTDEQKSGQVAYANKNGFIGRRLHDHKINEFNRNCIEVKTVDLRDVDGAHHKYVIEAYPRLLDGEDGSAVASCELTFQKGGLREAGVNGISDQALIAVVLDRTRSFNAGPFSCRENSIVITKLEEALLWMQKRADDRNRRGVEGERRQ